MKVGASRPGPRTLACELRMAVGRVVLLSAAGEGCFRFKAWPFAEVVRKSSVDKGAFRLSPDEDV